MENGSRTSARAAPTTRAHSRRPGSAGGGGASDVEPCAATPRDVHHGHRSSQGNRMPRPTRWRGRPVLVVAVAVALSATPAAFALSNGHSRIVSPASWGPVDFGDQVEYRLQGDHCTDDRLRVAVTGAQRAAVRGRVSVPVPDLLHVGTCVGIVAVPSERAVRRVGWDSGDPIDVALVSRHDRVPLRYERIELEYGHAAAGAPEVITPAVRDTRGGKRDRAVQMSTGARRSSAARSSSSRARPRRTPTSWPSGQPWWQNGM